jgi:hypothetical protein
MQHERHQRQPVVIAAGRGWRWSAGHFLMGLEWFCEKSLCPIIMIGLEQRSNRHPMHFRHEHLYRALVAPLFRLL